MNNNFLFLIISTSFFGLSIITILTAPIISKAHISFFKGWGTTNCQKLEDDLDFEKSIGTYDEYQSALTIKERQIYECKIHNTMDGLEHACLIIDFLLGFVILFLAFINYIEPGNNLRKIIGIIGLCIGAICTVITFVYLGYSGYIFNTGPLRNMPILYSNKASWKWNGQRYVSNYDESSKDHDDQFAKIKDLGKKQYNYDSDIYRASRDLQSEFNLCRANRAPNSRMNYQGTKDCDYIWAFDVINNSVENKYLHDKWVTSIIFTSFMCVCGIGLSIFGFFIFKFEIKEGSSEFPIPVPISSYTTSMNRLKNVNNGNNESKNN